MNIQEAVAKTEEMLEGLQELRWTINFPFRAKSRVSGQIAILEEMLTMLQMIPSVCKQRGTKNDNEIYK